MASFPKVGLALGGAAAVTLAGAVYQAVATARDARRFPAPGTFVDLGDHRLHTVYAGDGRPAVVLEAGLGMGLLEWALVQPEVAKFTSVFAYDRLGYGWSDPVRRPRTAAEVVDDLHAVLHRSDVEAPYVLVGHSLGGFIARLYTTWYPEEVAGVVLVDSVHEDGGNWMPDRVNRIWDRRAALVHTSPLLARLGVYRLIMKSGVLDGAKSLPAEAHGAFKAFEAQAKKYDCVEQEWTLFRSTGTKRLHAVDRSLGDRPLRVLTAGKGAAALAANRFHSRQQLEEAQRAWRAVHADLAGLSSRGKQVIAEGAGHDIPLERPELVVEAIREVVEASRSR